MTVERKVFTWAEGIYPGKGRVSELQDEDGSVLGKVYREASPRDPDRPFRWQAKGHQALNSSTSYLAKCALIRYFESL